MFSVSSILIPTAFWSLIRLRRAKERKKEKTLCLIGQIFVESHVTKLLHQLHRFFTVTRDLKYCGLKNKDLQITIYR